MTLLLAYDCSVNGLILNECTSIGQTVQTDIICSQGDIKPPKSLLFKLTLSCWLAYLFNNTLDLRSKSSG